MKDLQTLVSEVLNLPINDVNDNLFRGKQEEWDSFNHLVLISEIERQLGVLFTLDEVASLQSYKELKACIKSKQK